MVLSFSLPEQILSEITEVPNVYNAILEAISMEKESTKK